MSYQVRKDDLGGHVAQVGEMRNSYKTLVKNL